MKISKLQYDDALNRIEELLPLVTEETSATEASAIELAIVSDVVETYEKVHYPIERPMVSNASGL